MNVVGTVQVLEAARAAGAQVVFTSTGGAIYGECEEPATEDAPRRPLSPYGIAKLCGEEYLLGWNRIHGSRHVVLRLANVYGPRQDSGLEGGVVSIFLERMLRGEQTTIFGDGLQERDFVYVGDVVAALLAAAGHDGRRLQRRHRAPTSVLDLHRACRAVAGSDAEPRVRAGAARRRPPLGARRFARGRASSAGAREVGLDEGLRRTWDWTGGLAVGGRTPGATGELASCRGGPALPARAVRPWRMATIVASLVAAVELVLLLGGAALLLAKPLSHALQRSHAEAAAYRSGEEADAGRRDAEAEAEAGGREAEARAEQDRRSLVLNGNGRNGAAAAAAARLHGARLRIAATGNARRHDYATSVVMYRPGFEAEGARLARDLRREGRRPARRDARTRAPRRPARRILGA